VDAGFKYRILVADDDTDSLASTAALLSKEGYVVLTARDGFEALAELQGGVPEIIVSELRMPNMSGFELLAVVRQRFPGIGVIVLSANFWPAGELPEGVLADRFLAKAENFEFELLETIRDLLSQSPIRTAHAKPEVAPAWVPHSATGYVVITCPSCLRSSSIRTRDVRIGMVQATSCIHCGAEIRYRLDITISRAAGSTVLERAQAQAETGQRAIAESKRAITASKLRIPKTPG